MGVLSGGIPDTLSVLAAGLRDGDACGLYGTGGWQPAWLTAVPPGRVYVALDRDATERGIALARTFGTRGRVLIPPEDLGTKGDLNDWLRLGAKGDPAAFRSILERALAPSPTPWALSDPAVAKRTWRRGISTTISTCATSSARSATKELSAAMRTCACFRSGLGSRSSHCRKRLGSLLRARRPSHRCPAGAPVVILTISSMCPENSLMYDFVKS